VEEYSTEEEQVEALRRWWRENGRSIIAAVIIALAASFSWQTWESSQEGHQEEASTVYEAMLRAIGIGEASVNAQMGVNLAEQLKQNFDGTIYAQFAALHLAALAVNRGELPEAEDELRWVLGKAAKGSDAEQVAQLRLARVLASSGDTAQALAILDDAAPGPYGASYAAARGDILQSTGRADEARDAYMQALAQADSNQEGLNFSVLQQKLQSLTPVAARDLKETVSGQLDMSEQAPAITDPVETLEQ
jgi:predicted negative regulator of RcsB-dependent stress response|tara:strand:- start:1268 stop:2014 length:747 start_codon:yes stop_codon:yes gene_type:complete